MEVEIGLIGEENFPGEDNMSNEQWSLVCEMSLWGWVAAVIGLILNSFPSRNVLNSKPAVVWGTCFLVLYFVWVVGMLKA